MTVSRRALINEVVRATAFAGVVVVGAFGLRALRPTSRHRPLVLDPPMSADPVALDEVLLVPVEGGPPMAFHRRCPHLGCKVNVDPDRAGFTCPCHGSRFDMRGNRTQGPAPHGLHQLDVRVMPDGRLRIA